MEKLVTIISHIYNEEYLLPFWLEHHSTIFNNGIIIDYYSSDNSVKIINKICPNWKVINTRNLNEDGSPNFESSLVDDEVREIEKTVEGFKICLNTTEFLILGKSSIEFAKSLCENHYYHFKPFIAISSSKNIFPRNLNSFFKNIEFLRDISDERGHRIMHSKCELEYNLGRHSHKGGDKLTNIYNEDAFIIWCGYYPDNWAMDKRKLQIQNNIPKSDIKEGICIHHVSTLEQFKEKYKRELEKINNENNCIDKLEIIHKIPKSDANIYYSDLVCDGIWGDDSIVLKNDTNLIGKTDFDKLGYKIFDMDEDFNNHLKTFLENKIKDLVSKNIKLEDYHNNITKDEHKIILNSMPFKSGQDDMLKFSKYIENFVSNKIGENVKIFNGDIWYRICRPTLISDNDYNPCHRDTYLDFYRNVVNIYLPIVGSNEKSSLLIQPESHWWKENEVMRTEGGAFFKYDNKKYSVDAIVASKKPLQMVRPNPGIEQVMIFSPYLVHGCSDNDNNDVTRVSIEIRFIKNDENGIKQEKDFNDFLKLRNWR